MQTRNDINIINKSIYNCGSFAFSVNSISNDVKNVFGFEIYFNEDLISFFYKKYDILHSYIFSAIKDDKDMEVALAIEDKEEKTTKIINTRGEELFFEKLKGNSRLEYFVKNNMLFVDNNGKKIKTNLYNENIHCFDF